MRTTAPKYLYPEKNWIRFLPFLLTILFGITHPRNIPQKLSVWWIQPQLFFFFLWKQTSASQLQKNSDFVAGWKSQCSISFHYSRSPRDSKPSEANTKHTQLSFPSQKPKVLSIVIVWTNSLNLLPRSVSILPVEPSLRLKRRWKSRHQHQTIELPSAKVQRTRAKSCSCFDFAWPSFLFPLLLSPFYVWLFSFTADLGSECQQNADVWIQDF